MAVNSLLSAVFITSDGADKCQFSGTTVKFKTIALLKVALSLIKNQNDIGTQIQIQLNL